jgi:uncharacterized protein
MFRPMRRKKQLLSDTETIVILESCTSGVLAVQGDDEYPYAVPLSFAYDDGKLYFHCAMKGHKLDALGRSEKASFCVIAADDIVPEKFTTHFRSAIAFGKARLVVDDEEKRRGLVLLAEKYSPDHVDAASADIEGDWNRVAVIALDIEHLTGKASIELVQAQAAAG